MELFHKLSDNEKSMMEHYIDAYAFSDSGERSADLEYIMRIWDRSKETLFHMFGDQFILSRDVEFTKGVDELVNEIEQVMYAYNSPCREFTTAFENWRSEHFNRYDDLWYSLGNLINPETLATNVFERESFEIVIGDMKPIKVNHGCHVTRILGKIANAFHLPGWEMFRVTHSQILNQKKLKGHMCLSIHPLDYMTMSDNECDWNSCMSWNDYGCYRQGTVEMMNSSSVVVAYLTAAEPMRMPGGGEWSNKKWRQLFIVDSNILANVKAYPYRNDELSKYVLGWLKELATAAGIGEFTEKIVNYDAYREFTIAELDNRPIEFNPSTYEMYNDFSDNQWAYFGVNIPAGTYRFCYSGDSECMSCGRTDCDFDGEGALVGTCCEERYYCDCCESYYSSDEDFVEIDGEWMCPNCADRVSMTDTFTGEVHHEDNMENIYLMVHDNNKLFDSDVYAYRYNLEPEYMKKYFKTLHCVHHQWREMHYVKAEELSEDGLHLFGYNTLKALLKDFNPDDTWGIDLKTTDEHGIVFDLSNPTGEGEN